VKSVAARVAISSDVALRDSLVLLRFHMDDIRA